MDVNNKMTNSKLSVHLKFVRRKVIMTLALVLALCAIVFVVWNREKHISSVDEQVTYLVNETTISADRERSAFDALESLGRPAIPYIVSHLSDMRPLADPEISVANKFPNAPEARALFGPTIVHDGLSILLGQMTNRECFVGKGISSSDVTERMRQRNRNQWIGWCKTHYPSQSKICGNEMQGIESDRDRPLCLN